MAPNKFVSKCILLPMSKLYGFGVGIRNLMFEWHILKQKRMDVPVIVIGNLSMGGTGKTPMTEYVINLLKYSHHIGVLSRGYRRKTKGFVLATSRSTPLDIGDEPYQIYQKFGREVSVAVCENRCEGIEELLKIDPAINLIVLDDAFQHRYVKPDISIVLTEFNKPVFFDRLLPLGRLREPQKAIYRADIIVVTKCPEKIKDLERRIFQNKLNLQAFQKLYFSRMEYLPLRPVFPEETAEVPTLQWMSEYDSILALSGIANPRPFVKRLKQFRPKVKVKIFPDHHNFSRKDLAAIQKKYDEMEGETKIIVTTEKDAVRLANNPYFPKHLKNRIFYQPIAIRFDEHQTATTFDDFLKKKVMEA